MKDKHLANRVGTIEIGDNVFLGAGSMILYDVKIGNNVIIGAGALVNKNIPDGGVYAGIPAVKIGEFDSYMEKTLTFSEKVNWNNEESRKSIIKKQKEYFWAKNVKFKQ
ncbi:acyltransferase [Mediterraneibacter glycyrrhizinilyticus]|uniref:acyltransferase n=1 Tax=Mediterraneibacter glycyrrhizinilyticus TaxID=342942 RepID=UPI0025AACF52|nr:DapH/DapD/GlmU-related protein [Mediterraneibacter glycyrrhizinilyticus]MDN0043138.1 DapH/DapD/GlmU-related protein [Mediterraneibacter glycyrrhizinilyticus]